MVSLVDQTAAQTTLGPHCCNESPSAVCHRTHPHCHPSGSLQRSWVGSDLVQAREQLWNYTRQHTGGFNLPDKGAFECAALDRAKGHTACFAFGSAHARVLGRTAASRSSLRYQVDTRQTQLLQLNITHTSDAISVALAEVTQSRPRPAWQRRAARVRYPLAAAKCMCHVPTSLKLWRTAVSESRRLGDDVLALPSFST